MASNGWEWGGICLYDIGHWRLWRTSCPCSGPILILAVETIFDQAD